LFADMCSFLYTEASCFLLKRNCNNRKENNSPNIYIYIYMNIFIHHLTTRVLSQSVASTPIDLFECILFKLLNRNEMRIKTMKANFISSSLNFFREISLTQKHTSSNNHNTLCKTYYTRTIF